MWTQTQQRHASHAGLVHFLQKHPHSVHLAPQVIQISIAIRLRHANFVCLVCTLLVASNRARRAPQVLPTWTVALLPFALNAVQVDFHYRMLHPARHAPVALLTTVTMRRRHV